eukprot:CAMPEP_0197183666 /NCGR_PEP_ID=MMETSP1423-20130617/7943_1 /TAXON_ID=476441 /ORGANISM="Pseudo-nitzschia heimii, Strain UNC1101" /LENGTH=201 /DNA_ID=CAMNT_0042634267 /DNA_START=453 /DNA_END=1059 /DNA_ORIENTATION=+
MLTSRRGTSTSTALGIAKSGGKMIETEKEFAEHVLSKDLTRPVLVFFTAPWCGPCRLTVPVVKDVMKQYSGDLDVVEVCTDDLAEVAEESGVVSIPTIQFYYDGAALETHSIVGCVAKSVLSNAIQKVIEDVAKYDRLTTGNHEDDVHDDKSLERIRNLDIEIPKTTTFSEQFISIPATTTNMEVRTRMIEWTYWMKPVGV